MAVVSRTWEGVGGLFRDRPKPTPDVVMFLLMAGLMALSGIMVYSATFVRLEAEIGDPSAAMRRQFVFAGLALAAFIGGSLFDYRHYRRLLIPIYVSTVVLLVAVLFFPPHQGASRWIPIGPFQFQPSEFAKVALVVVLAAFLAAESERRLKWRRLGLALLLTAIPGYLIFRQPDLGTMLVIGFIAVGMLFVAGTGIKQVLVLLIAGVAGVVAVFQLDVLRNYQMQRLAGYFDQTYDLQGVNWNLYQSQIAIGSGQLFGRGLFQGTQTRLSFIPSQTTDFIFTTVGEQFGFIGGSAVLIVYSILVWRVLMVAAGAPSRFGVLIAVGMASLLSFHIFVNVGMTIGLVPVTGLPLPFLSAGGSAMIAMAGGLGIVNSVWRSRTPVGEFQQLR
ncbi:MAG: rod shape-determining protein RodA [bacterium]|nr:rod shape-determining protein RodA [bacterium]MDE0437288.1 rod shape-determining protein RodA [bacterium]